LAIDALSTRERQQLLLSVGTHRGQRPLSPIEVATLFSRVLDNGGSLTECAQAANLEGTTIVSRFVRLLSLSEAVKPVIDWGVEAGSISFSAATEIARLERLQDQEALVQGALMHRLSGSETRQVVQLRKRSGRPLKECLEEVVGMRARVEKRYVYMGTITHAVLKPRLEAKTQRERDEILRTAARHVLGPTDVSVAKLGPTSFTLVGDAKFGEKMTNKKATLEQEINDGLLKALA
jgi:hypothetical protein